MKYSAAFLFVFLWTLGIAQHALPADVVATIEHRIAYGISPGIAVGIIDKNGVQYYNFGLTKEGGKPIDERSIFEIGSITKTFTAILLADMVKHGKLKLDDPANKYLPEKGQLPSRGDKQITLELLSNHTSGLPRMPDNMTPADPSNPYADYTVDQMYAFIKSHTLGRDVGAEYEYSNLAQGLLGHILALRARKTYEELLMTTITEPLKMQETRIVFSENMRDHLAYGHSQGTVVSNWDIPTLAGAGAIRSSTHDMLRYVGANLGLIESPLSAAMALTHQKRYDGQGFGVGLGWHINSGAEGDVIWHNGGTGGYRTFAGFVKETGRGVVILTNSDVGADDIGFHLLNSDARMDHIKPHVARELRKHIDAEGLKDLAKKFAALKEANADLYDFGETEINSLGYYYLGVDNVDAALALFKINVDEYPESFNVWDSYAEALMKKGETAAAIENYNKSLEINPGNTNGIEMLAKMGVKYQPADIKVREEVLQSYVGKYQLTPDFAITIARNGGQLIGQATGQGPFDMFPSAEDEFYLKVVSAQIRFNRNDDGTIKSLTLFQGGQVLEGMRVD